MSLGSALSHTSARNEFVGRQIKLASLQEILSYRNEAVVARFRKKLAVSDSEAEMLFSDVKRFLWLCSVAGVISPPPQIDEGWHHFILFTQDYDDFCRKYFGYFLHHRPSRPDDVSDGGQLVRDTLSAIERHFGSISALGSNWEYPFLQSENRQPSCSSDSVSCAPTPSCSSSINADSIPATH